MPANTRPISSTTPASVMPAITTNSPVRSKRVKKSISFITSRTEARGFLLIIISRMRPMSITPMQIMPLMVAGFWSWGMKEARISSTTVPTSSTVGK